MSYWNRWSWLLYYIGRQTIWCIKGEKKNTCICSTMEKGPDNNYRQTGNFYRQGFHATLPHTLLLFPSYSLSTWLSVVNCTYRSGENKYCVGCIDCTAWRDSYSSAQCASTLYNNPLDLGKTADSTALAQPNTHVSIYICQTRERAGVSSSWGSMASSKGHRWSV